MNRGLKATVGAGCAGILLACVPRFEGIILKGYKDPIGIVTACSGHTATAVLGRPYTREECDKLLEQDLVTHAEGVLSCVTVPLDTGRKAAAISLAYNIGIEKFCGSTFARRLNAEDPGACAELERWKYAGGQELPGLAKRRKVERAICEGHMG